MSSTASPAAAENKKRPCPTYSVDVGPGASRLVSFIGREEDQFRFGVTGTEAVRNYVGVVSPADDIQTLSNDNGEVLAVVMHKPGQQPDLGHLPQTVKYVPVSVEAFDDATPDFDGTPFNDALPNIMGMLPKFRNRALFVCSAGMNRSSAMMMLVLERMLGCDSQALSSVWDRFWAEAQGSRLAVAKADAATACSGLRKAAKVADLGLPIRNVGDLGDRFSMTADIRFPDRCGNPYLAAFVLDPEHKPKQAVVSRGPRRARRG